ncbi:hypothetical protein ACVR0S_09550 [Streptococcus dentapri]|uniref:DUF3899 domain-containing protein n=1 Tax=Streptococcus dentapri TaxID=573564 RepID=A0ABV8CYY5_9STRE
MIILALGINWIHDEMVQSVVGLVWTFVFVAGLIISKYIRQSSWEARLDKKYHLTKNKNRHILKECHESDEEQFLWSKNPYTRPIMMIFWGIIIPLLFIIKYALRLF